jgi:hypothetical protein
MTSLRNDWNTFLFSMRPASPLGLLRICFGLVILSWCILIAPDLKVWYSESGLMNLDAMRAWGMNNTGLDLLAMHTWSVSALGEPWFQDVTDFRITVALFALLMLSAFCFMIGYKTRVASIVMWALLTTFHHRSMIMLNGGDTMQRNVAFLLMFADCGAACSVDRLIRIARGQERGDSIPMMEMWPIRLLQLQVSAVYISAVASKLEGIEWQNGSAFYYAMHLADLSRFSLFGLQNQLWFYNFLTYFTLFAELSLGTLIWIPRARKYVIGLGIMLHAGIEYTMTVPLFSYTMVCSYLSFASSDSVDIFVSWLRNKFARSAISIPADAALPGRSAELLRALDSLRLVRFDTLPDTKIDAGFVRRVMWRLPITWAIVGIPPLLILVILPVWWLLAPFDLVWPIAAAMALARFARSFASRLGAGPADPPEPFAASQEDVPVAAGMTQS